MRVLDHDGDGAGRRARDQQPTQQVLQRGLAQLALEGGRQVAVGNRDARAPGRAAARGPRVPASSLPTAATTASASLSTSRPSRSSPDLAPRGVRRGLGGDRAGLPRRHQHAVRDELADQLGHQPGLAGAGLGLDDHDLAPAGPASERRSRSRASSASRPTSGVGGARHRGGPVPGRRGRAALGPAPAWRVPFTVISSELVPDEPVARRHGDVLVHQHRPGGGAGHQPGRQVDRLPQAAERPAARRGRRCRCAAGRTRRRPARRRPARRRRSRAGSTPPAQARAASSSWATGAPKTAYR